MAEDKKKLEELEKFAKDRIHAFVGEFSKTATELGFNDKEYPALLLQSFVATSVEIAVACKIPKKIVADMLSEMYDMLLRGKKL